MEVLRRRWYVPVGSGLTITLPALAGLIIYTRELELPFRPALYVFAITAGVVVALLTAMNFLLPLSIRFKASRIIFFYPRRIDWTKYEKVRRCELTAEPHPVFRALGDGSTVLFQLYWNPRVDAEALRRFLATRNIPLERVSEQARQGERRPDWMPGY